VVVSAVLYLAREVLIPLATAILLAFLLAPAARRLERWRLGRVPSTLIVVALGFALIGGVGWVAADQAVSLAARLPEYRENIALKIRELRRSPQGALGRAAEAIRELESEAAGATREPLPVKETPASPLEALGEYLAPVVKPAGTALAVVIFTILMLLHRENMRERLIGLVGAGRINLTTQAMGEAASRVSRYLFMLLVVNACFGIPFGIALYFIGVPNALLWGLLATLLRFIPYAGVWVAVAMPAALAIAIGEDWSMLGWTLGVFALLEAVAVYVAEPILYGRSAGLSAMAVIAAAIFWTWLWGPVGLLLAMPLTVCLAVIGRHVPQLGFLNTLLGVEPVLEPPARFYQRLLALDSEEALELAEEYVKQKGAPAFYDEVLVPALVLAERDRHQEALDAARERFIFATARELIEEEVGEAPQPATGGAPPACLVAAHDEADHVAALALGRLAAASVVPHPLLTAEVLELIAEHGAKTVLISAVPPHAAAHAGALAKRLRRRFPELRILIGLWTREGDIQRARARLLQSGADEVVTTFPEALERLR
jgi:predicted PurR-regulated permease PerM